MSQSYINVIGAGLAGSEAAYQIAKRGIPVKLYEMRVKSTPQHKTSDFAELVCSNSLRGFANECGWFVKRRNAPFGFNHYASSRSYACTGRRSVSS